MIQQQRFGGSLLSTPGRLVADEGVASLGRGCIGATGRESVYTACFLGVQPVLQNHLTTNHLDMFGGSTTSAGMAASVFSGGLAATVTHPLDTIKTCMQGDAKREVYGSLKDTYAKIYADQGVQGFFRGHHNRYFLTPQPLLSLAP